MTDRVQVLAIRNAFHVPSMDHKLVKPFTIRSCGVAINDSPKINCEDPVVNDHIVYFEHFNLRIPLKLNVVFSNFHTRVPTEIELHDCEKLSLTPDSSALNTHYQFYE